MTIAFDAFRTIVAILMLLLIPGGVLIYALFPRANFDALIRFFLSVLTSICLSVIIAYTSLRFGSGLEPFALIMQLYLITAVAAAIAFFRHIRKQKASMIAGYLPMAGVTYRTDRAIISRILLGVVFIGFAGSAITPFLSDIVAVQPMTEFYVDTAELGPDGIDLEAQHGKFTLPIVIQNREHSDKEYRIAVWADELRVSVSEPIYVAKGELWRHDFTVELANPGSVQALTLALQADGNFSESTLVNRASSEPDSKTLAQLSFWLSEERTSIARSNGQ